MTKLSIVKAKKKGPYIFIVDDDPIYRELIKYELEENNYSKIETYSVGKQCIENLHKMPDIILLDYCLDETMDGMEVLRKIKAHNPDIQVIMLSSQDKLKVAVDSMKRGVYDYVEKNDVAMTRILVLIGRICKWNNLLRENRKIKKVRIYELFGGMTIIIIALYFIFLF